MDDRTRGIIYLLTVATLWGFSFVATKALLGHLDPATIAFLRFSIATVILFAVCRGSRSRSGIAFVALAGFLGITCYFMFENVALTYTTPTNSSLIAATIPVFFLLTVDVLRRRFSGAVRYLGAAIALVGVGVLILNGKFNLHLNPVGDILMFGAVFSWISYTLIIERIGPKDLLVTSRDLTLAGTVFLLPFVLLEGGSRFDIASQGDLLMVIAALVYLGALCSAFGFLYWNKAIHLAGSSTSTTALYLVPLVTILGDSLILGNVPNVYVVVGAALVISGIYLSERR